MNQSSAGEAYHENLTIRLKECCKECPFTTSDRPCKKAKTNCCFYNITIAEYVVTTYSEKVLEQIPAESFVRGLRAHRYSVELRQTTEIQI